MKRLLFPFSLIALYGLLVDLAVPAGCVFGSQIDWLCQHVVLAETIRHACLEQHTLLPSWIDLGGGSNGYQFAYYGFLRPDIVFGCLFPQIPMQSLFLGYMAVVGLVGALLLYGWLCVETGRKDAAWVAAVLFMTAGCLFHLHRQIMFVNYFPFLILAFLCIKKGKLSWLPLCLLGVCFSSFYYAPAAFIAVAWYWYRLEGTAFWKKWLPAVFLASGMAAALLIPTGHVLLEHRSGQSVQLGLSALIAPIWNLKSLLYDKYGIGLSMLALYAMLVSLRMRALRKDAIFFLIISLFPLASYLFNATLYARPKILMPFLPLVLLLVARCLAQVFERLEHKERRLVLPIWPFFIIAPLVWMWSEKAYSQWIVIDAGVLLFLVLLSRCNLLNKYLAIFLLLIAPVGLYFANASTENWVTQQAFTALNEGIERNAMNMVPLEKQERFDSLLQVLNKANALHGEYSRSSMYSSITNQAYASFYYDTLLAPIQINNRVALLTADDPFLFHLLGTQYLETTSDHVPSGYQVMAQQGEWVLAKNDEVLPRIYTTNDVVTQSAFEPLDDYEKLDVLARKTVVEGTHGENEIQAGMAAYSPELALQSALPKGLHIEPRENGWLIQAQKTSRLILNINNPLPEEIVLCQFDVENKTRQAVTIEINGTLNMLSGASAPYPNNNTCFHYKFSPVNANGVQQLDIQLSPGEYYIKNIQWHRYSPHHFSEKTTTPVVLEKSRDLLEGKVEINETCVLSTTIPAQKGLQILVDGKQATIIRVNTAFAGTWLTPGKHSIQLKFSPPGKGLGIVISAVFAILYIVYFIKRRRN